MIFSTVLRFPIGPNALLLKHLSRSVHLRNTTPVFLATPTLDADIYTLKENTQTHT